MIKLTDETKIVTKASKNYKVGDVVDNSLYLVRVDSNNLALKRGDTIENYLGNVRTALYRSLNYALKGSEEALTLEYIKKTIQSMDDTIKRLDKECVE